MLIVSEPFAPEVAQWISEPFAPEAAQWISEPFAPEAAQWISEPFAPEAAQWIIANLSALCIASSHRFNHALKDGGHFGFGFSSGGDDFFQTHGL
jgi:hypothetical protein